MIVLAWFVVSAVGFFTLVPAIGYLLDGGSYGESLLTGLVICCMLLVAISIVAISSWAISTVLEHYEVTLL
ncbi:MAG TPA: hypothetical protein V6D20_03455 [Candidatus Obscuribacterales bacterium]